MSSPPLLLFRGGALHLVYAVKFTDLVRGWIPLCPKDHPQCGTECEVDVVGYGFPNLEIRSRLTVLPREDVCISLTVLTVLTHDPPSLPRWRLGGFPLPRNRKGIPRIGRADVNLGGKCDFAFPRGYVVHPENPPQFGTGMIIWTRGKMQTQYLHPPRKMHNFPRFPLNHPCHKLRPLLAWTCRLGWKDSI